MSAQEAATGQPQGTVLRLVQPTFFHASGVPVCSAVFYIQVLRCLMALRAAFIVLYIAGPDIVASPASIADISAGIANIRVADASESRFVHRIA